MLKSVRLVRAAEAVLSAQTLSRLKVCPYYLSFSGSQLLPQQNPRLKSQTSDQAPNGSIAQFEAINERYWIPQLGHDCRALGS